MEDIVSFCCMFIWSLSQNTAVKFLQKLFLRIFTLSLPKYALILKQNLEFDGEHDHVHLLINYPPKIPVSTLVNSLKGVSSRLVRKKNYPNVQNKLWGGALWLPGYFAGSCGGAPITIIRQYIDQQQTPL